MKKLHSFDIFETLLVRSWARPRDLFLELGRRLAEAGLVSLSPERWQELRSRSEAESRRSRPGAETTLNCIYDFLGRKVDWTSDLKQAAMNLEIEIERKSLRPVPAGVRELESARAAGCRIAFVSDMYLSADCLRSLLADHGLIQPGDLLLVSGEEGCSKADGGLFRRLSELAALPLEQIEHHGDHPRSDHEVPRSMGLAVSPLCDAGLNRYETAMADSLPGDRLFASSLAACARLARLQNPVDTLSRESVLREVTCGVAGPLLLGYVHWVLTRARELGLRRLYFISRDGQILLKLARKIQHRLGFAMELRYLHGSRLAWFLPGRDDGAGVAVEADQGAESSPGVQVQHVPSSLVREYLLAQGLGDDLPWAMVDLGWRGRLQAALGSLLGPGYARPLTGFYFALSDRARARPGDTMLSWFAGRVPGLWTAWTTYGTVLEIFAAADHGQVTGYRREAGRVVPVLRAPGNSTALAWGLEIQQSAILVFADYCLELSNPGDWRHESWQSVVGASASVFLQSPGRPETCVYGDFIVSPGLSEDGGRTLVRGGSRFSLILALLLRRRRLEEIPWIEGEIVRTLPFPAAWLLFLKSRRHLAFLFERAWRRR